MATHFDPLELTQDLIKLPSITPIDAGAMDFLSAVLIEIGFKVRRYNFEGIENLYARLGTRAPNFCFAGHTDVVPTGDISKWHFDPFSATIDDKKLFGRGAADMKSAIAAFACAAQKYISQNGEPDGSISLLITGDEEGIAINGTVKLLAAIEAEGEKIDHCIVGEPTCREVLGDMIKNGRRGSINCTITSHGKQGHVAYPDLAQNPIPPLVSFLHKVQSQNLDDGADGFQPSNLEIVTIDVGNSASNVIPQSANAKLNIRFNTNHSGETLSNWLRSIAEEAGAKSGGELQLDIKVSGEPFFTEPSTFTKIIQNATHGLTGILPVLSTTGGTSDARFIKSHCPVCEFGIVGATLHQIDENVEVEDIYKLTEIYKAILLDYFNTKW
jgi:succinyl-diaminopimelate desuccinylase